MKNFIFASLFVTSAAFACVSEPGHKTALVGCTSPNLIALGQVWTENGKNLSEVKLTQGATVLDEVVVKHETTDKTDLWSGEGLELKIEITPSFDMRGTLKSRKIDAEMVCHFLPVPAC